jgi:HD-GYP domain-containing protein (c-di-GMP phosphodiesterase class II)
MKEPSREVRISVKGLEPGMFVCRLDRPWIETPFPLEGMQLRSETEVRDIQGICSFVYVDTLAGKSPDPRYLQFDAPGFNGSAKTNEYAALRRTDWTLKTEFEVELKQAESAHGILQDDITQVMGDLQLGKKLNVQKLKHGVEAMISSILRNPAAFVWLKEIRRQDEYSYHHAMGCAIWAATFGRHLGLEKHELHDLALAGLLCDVGKTRVPMELLAKQEALSADEGKLVREHVRHSLDIVCDTPDLSPTIIEIVATHHERHDGSGYPQGLEGDQIPIFGRMMGLVDSYDAMTSVRPYAASRSPHQAVSELYAHRGRLYQPELVEQFIQACGIYPVGSLVELSNGEVGVITAVHSLKRLRPRVMLLLDARKRPLDQFRPVDLSRVEVDALGNPLSVKQGLPSGAYGVDPRELFLD